MLPLREERKQTLSKISTVTVIMIFFAFVFYAFDSGPLLPPFKKGMDSLDCHTLSFHSFATRYGVIDVYCNISETIEFPIEYIPHFISVHTVTDGNQIPYHKNNLVNMSRVGDSLNFSIPHVFAGHVSVTLKCLAKQFANFEVDFTEVNDTDQEYYSTKQQNGNEIARFGNVCMEYDKMLFFSQTGGTGVDLSLSPPMRFEIIGWALPGYLNMKNVSRMNETGLVITAFDPIPWKAILFNLQPIARSIESTENLTNPKRIYFFFRELPPKGSGEIIKRLSSFPGSKMKDIACFKTLAFPSMRNGVTDSESIEAALQSNFSALRTYFTKGAPPLHKIIIASSVSHLEPIVREMFPNWTVVTLSSRTELTRAVDAVSSSSILIGNHLSNLIHMIWMAPNRSSVIDLSPDTVSCNRWAEQLATRHNISYHGLPRGETCACKNFDCYPRGAGENQTVDVSIFRENLQSAVDFVNSYVEEKPQVVEKKDEIVFDFHNPFRHVGKFDLGL